MKRLMLIPCMLFVLAVLNAQIAAAQPLPVNYPIVYVKFPKLTVNDNYTLPEAHYATRMPRDRHSDLMILYPDGHEEVLVAAGDGAIVDPTVSFDAKWVYYAKFQGVKSSDFDNNYFFYPRPGADIYRVNVETKQIVRLTNQEWSPSTSLHDRTKTPLSVIGKGIYNLSPCPLPGGRVMYVTSKNAYAPNGAAAGPIINLQLAIMDDDGKNQEVIGHFNLGSAMHPHIMKDGRVMFSSAETQGLKRSTQWGLWAIWPDGTKWEPLMSSLMFDSAFHFHSQLSNGEVVVTDYYHQNNRGFGTILAFPADRPKDKPAFGGAFSGQNPLFPISNAGFHNTYYPFSPAGLRAMTLFTHREDSNAAKDSNGVYMGKVTQPSGAPGNDMLLVWSGGAVGGNNVGFPDTLLDAGIYLIKEGKTVNKPQDMILIKNDPMANEMQPRALVPYQDIYGIPEPKELAPLKNNGGESLELPAGTPFGLVGTSSMIKRDTAPGRWEGGFNPKYRGQNGYLKGGDSSNFQTQGADIGFYEDSDIYAVRILAMDPQLDRGGTESQRYSGFTNFAREPLRILGEIPLIKKDSNGNVINDIEGNPDTSFLVKIPADVSFTFQTIDKEGMALNISQTWHQLRPGETRNDCGGCHAHSKMPLDFKTTAASRPDYVVPDLTRTTTILTKDGNGSTVTKTVQAGAVDVEYYRDIKPVIQRSCAGCHSKNMQNPEAGLILDDDTIVSNTNSTMDGAEKTYQNLHKYIWAFQGKRSYLMWKIMGKRIDGLTNADLPSPSDNKSLNLLPAGITYHNADIDYIGTIMPPPNSGYQPLSDDEKMTFARWIDLGSPANKTGINTATQGWFFDAKRPTVSLATPRAGVNSPALDEIRIGMFDYYSGLNEASFEVIADFTVNGKAAGTNLAPDFSKNSAQSIWTLKVEPPLTNLQEGKLTVHVKDNQGNLEEIDRIFSVTTALRPRAPAGLRGEAVN